jgi:hypothetical protein
MKTTLFLVSLLQVIFLVLCSYIGCQIDSTQTNIELKSSVDQSEIPFNRELTFTVQAIWEGEQDRFRITPIVPPQCEKFEITGSSSVNQTRMEKGKTMSVKTFRFILKPMETGGGRIGSVQLNYIDSATKDSSSLFTQPIDVQITAPVKERGAKYKTILLIVVFSVLIYVIYTAKRRGKRVEIKREQQSEKQTTTEELLEQKTSRKLEEIREQVQNDRLDSCSSDISRLLTRYMEARYQIVTSGKTTNDIIDSLIGLDLPPERITLLKSILSACDRAKFAAERMERNKCEEITEMARKFLEQNR